MMSSALNISANFIRDKLARCSAKPLVVGLQGPQGSGKSFLSSCLREELGRTPAPLRVVVLSIDDLYLPHSALTSLANQNPHNSLLKGRGQPGTHDVQLGISLLSALRKGCSQVRLPSFDKSLFDGEGDRLPMDDERIMVVDPPAVDAIILEGWCVGFQPIPLDELDRRWEHVWKRERERLGIPGTLCTKSNIAELNESLSLYKPLWDMFDVFIQLRPSDHPSESNESPYSIVYRWRLEQEHYMKSLNGNRGMTDEAVRRFVDRYIPGYVFFSEGVLEEGNRWKGQHLVLTIDANREVIDVDTP